jgi:hypothetical protein
MATAVVMVTKGNAVRQGITGAVVMDMVAAMEAAITVIAGAVAANSKKMYEKQGARMGAFVIIP